MHKIRVAIIGFGMSGQLFHLPPLLKNPRYVVKMIMTKNTSRIKEIKRISQDIEVISSYDYAINSHEIDLIVIATSNDVHEEYTKKALLNNKHVVCEKPFVETYEKAKALFELAKERNLILRVFHNRAYDGDILTIKSLIEQDKLGRTISFSTRFDRYLPSLSHNWRYENHHMAGIYYDLAPHLVHHVLSIFGKPKSVSLKLFKDHKDIIVDDHFEMMMHYKNMTALLGAATYERHSKPRFEIIGEKATYIKYGFDQPDVNYDIKDFSTLENVELSSLISDYHQENVPIEIGKHYIFYDHLAQMIDHPSKNLMNEDIQLDVIMIMEKGLESFHKKTDVII